MLPRSRALALAGVLTAALFGAAASAHAAAPPQGLYESCTPRTAVAHCEDRLRKMGAAGFKVVVNGSLASGDVSDDELLAYGRAAQSSGMQVMLVLSQLWDPANAARVAHLVSLVKGQPWLYGYYIADEPKAERHAELLEFTTRLKVLDPVHPRLLMGCGLCGHNPGVAGFTDLDVMLGTDRYPVFDQRASAEDAGDAVDEVSSQLRHIASNSHRRTAIALQAWNWGDSILDCQPLGLNPATTRFPTTDEMRAMRDAAEDTLQPDLILWWNATQVLGWEESQRPSYWAQPVDHDARWASLVKAAFGDRAPAAGGADASAGAGATGPSAKSGAKSQAAAGAKARARAKAKAKAARARAKATAQARAKAKARAKARKRR